MKSRRWLVPNLGHSGAGSGPPSAATVGRWEDGAELLGLGSEPRPATATAPSWGGGRGALGKGGSPHRCLRPSPRPRSPQPGPAGTFCGGGGCTGAAASAWGSCGTRNLSTLLQALLGLTGKVSLCWGGGELMQRIEPFFIFFFLRRQWCDSCRMEVNSVVYQKLSPICCFVLRLLFLCSGTQQMFEVGGVFLYSLQSSVWPTGSM